MDYLGFDALALVAIGLAALREAFVRTRRARALRTVPRRATMPGDL